MIQPQQYSSKIIKAGALVADVKMTLTNWNEDEGISENIKRLQQTNVFGKSSRHRVQEMLSIFRERYLINPAIRRALIKYVNSQLSEDSLKLILFFHTAKTDHLLYDLVVKYLGDMNKSYGMSISTDTFARTLSSWNDEGLMPSHWGETTINRVARNVATTLRDFGILKGAVNKQLSNFPLPLATFVHVALILYTDNPSGLSVLNHSDWKLFFLSTQAVERLFFEAHQNGLLSYYAAGSTVRLSFPKNNIEDYADVIIQRAP